MMVSRTPSPSHVFKMAIDAGRSNHASNDGRIIPLIDDLLSSDSLKRLEEECQPDSGYGSHESSQMGTPDAPRTASHCGLDDAVQHELRLSKTKTIMSFDYKMDDVYTARFCNIQSSVESLLVQYTRRKSLLRSSTARHKPMAIRPMMLGNNSQDAKPHIVVFCASEMRKRIQHFFDTDTLVRAFCKPDNPLLPSFEIAVCGCAPQLRTDTFEMDVVWDANPTELKTAGMCVVFSPLTRKTKFDNTLCGTPIRFEARGKQRNATLGGLVKITYDDGSSVMMGLTAGHAAAAILQDDGVLGVLEEEASDDDSFVDDSDSEFSAGDDDEITVPETDEAISVDSSNSWVFEKPSHQATKVTLPNPLTNALKHRPGVDEKAFPLFDWAIFPFEGCSKINELPILTETGDRCCITTYRQFSPAALNDAPAERVILMCGSSGLKYGRMVHQSTRILIQPATKFVNAYLVTLDDDASFADGDSGTWVISQDTTELLGHLVATDFFGAGYIVLACDIFRDIAQNNGIKEVVLPAESEIWAESAAAPAVGDADLASAPWASLTITDAPMKTSEAVGRRAHMQYGNIFDTEWLYRSLPSGHLVYPQYSANFLCLRDYSMGMTLAEANSMMRNQRGYKRAFINADSPSKEILLEFDTVASASLALIEFSERFPEGQSRRYILQQFATSDSDLPPPVQKSDRVTGEPSSTTKRSQRSSSKAPKSSDYYEDPEPDHKTIPEPAPVTTVSLGGDIVVVDSYGFNLPGVYPPNAPPVEQLRGPRSQSCSRGGEYTYGGQPKSASCSSVDSGYSSLMSASSSPNNVPYVPEAPETGPSFSEKRSSRRRRGSVIFTTAGDAPTPRIPPRRYKEDDNARDERIRMRIAAVEILARPDVSSVRSRTRRGRDRSTTPNPRDPRDDSGDEADLESEPRRRTERRAQA